MTKNIILVDADHLDYVAFDMIVNFERMLGRRIPPADLPQWLDCIALDGGLRPADNAIQAIFIHDKERKALQHFAPANFADELDKKAFTDHLGEFTLASFAVESVVSKTDFFVEALESILLDREVERVMVVGDFDGWSEESTHLLARVKQMCAQPPKSPSDADPLPPKDITLFSMQPISGRGFQSEILGYSLTAALGVRSEELT